MLGCYTKTVSSTRGWIFQKIHMPSALEFCMRTFTIIKSHGRITFYAFLAFSSSFENVFEFSSRKVSFMKLPYYYVMLLFLRI